MTGRGRDNTRAHSLHMQHGEVEGGLLNFIDWLMQKPLTVRALHTLLNFKDLTLILIYMTKSIPSNEKKRSTSLIN